MQNLNQQFNSLNGLEVDRKTLEIMLKRADKEGNLIISNRVAKILHEYSDDRFLVEIVNLVEPFALNGAQDKDVFQMLNGLEYMPENDDIGLGKAVSSTEIYDMVTQKMIDLIEKANSGEYKRAWKEEGYIVPYNFISKKAYRGVNVVMLTPPFSMLDNPYFLTFKQVQELGGKVKKGSSGYKVIYYSSFDKEKDDDNNSDLKNTDDKEKVFFIKYYNVFNGADIEDIDFGLENFSLLGKVSSEIIVEGKNEAIDIADAIIENYPAPQPKIKFTGSKAFYRPGTDEINMPDILKFRTSQDFYRTLFHEISHSTGAEKRLNRDIENVFGSKEYAFEELVAEFGAVFLSAQAGIMFYTNQNHAAYLKGWNEHLLKNLKNDNRFLIKASSAAQKLSDFVLQPDDAGTYLFLKNLQTKKTVKNIATKKVATPPQPKTAVKSIVKKIAKKKQIIQQPEFDFDAKPAEQKIATIAKTTKLKVVKTTKPKVAKSTKAIPAPAPIAKTKFKEKKITFKTSPNHDQDTQVINLPLYKIFTDEKRFQNRNELDQRIVANIVKNFDSTQLDPIIVWEDMKQRKYFVLAGHHRFEALKQLKKPFAPVKIANYTEAEAIDFAKVKSNANRTLELPQERAKIYRELLKKGISKTKVLEQAKELEGKNASYVVNLAALNPNGLTLQALNALANTPDKQNATIIEKIADWIGAARLQNEQITNAHEKEMFDFLQDKDSSERIKTKVDFLQKITAITTMFFDYDTALNLKRFKYQTEGEKLYDEEFSALKKLIDTTTANRDNLRERINNPAHPQWVNPKNIDYDQSIKALDAMVDKYAIELKQLQSKLNELGRNKGYYTNQGSNQVGLFGVRKKKVLDKKISAEPIKNRRTSLAYKLANRSKATSFFEVANVDFSKFFGKIERKNRESVVITITGGEGSGKTRFAFQFMNALAQHQTVGHASMEEHVESQLYSDKADQYLNSKAQQNISTEEIKSMQDLDALARNNDVIIIDSFQKMRELNRGFEVDKDLRKKYDGKLFLIVYQQTTDGKMRGGSTSQFDADIVCFTESFDDYRENYVYATKNRYQKQALNTLHLNIFTGKLEQTETAFEPETQQAANRLSFVVY